jgi:PPOX class probable FMN-dependent enzyme
MGETEITTEAGLREALGGLPGMRAATKARDTLAPAQQDWLRRSPFCVIATSDADGNCDASPKGDPAGQLIHVLSPSQVAIPERPGNKRADGYLNILRNPRVGIISLIPGRDDTLRVSGRATLVRDAPWFGTLAVRGKPPVLAMVVDVDQVFFHCAKAFLRSRLWQPSSWTDPAGIPSVAELCKLVQDTPETVEELEAHYSPGYYATLLY